MIYGTMLAENCNIKVLALITLFNPLMYPCGGYKAAVHSFAESFAAETF